MKKDTVSKLKFKRLQRQLHLPLWKTIGLLEAIWHCAMTNAPDGDIGRLSNEDIAAAIEWDGDADELVGALVTCGWLDRDDEFGLIVHDWSDHVPTYMKGAYEKHNKLFADQSAKQRAKHHPKHDAEQGCLAGAPILSHPDPSDSSPSTGAAAPPVGGQPVPSKSPPSVRAEDVLIPVALDTPEFRAARDRWLARRRKNRWSVDILHVERQYERLLPLGVALAIECMDYSTDNNYQALLIEKYQTNGKPRNGTATSPAARPVPKGTTPTFTDQF